MIGKGQADLVKVTIEIDNQFLAGVKPEYIDKVKEIVQNLVDELTQGLSHQIGGILYAGEFLELFIAILSEALSDCTLEFQLILERARNGEKPADIINEYIAAQIAMSQLSEVVEKEIERLKNLSEKQDNSDTTIQ